MPFRRSGYFPVDFYPRPPRGGRRRWIAASCRVIIFLSTPSARRATLMQSAKVALAIFLSTPSARRATDLLSKTVLIRVISIHALREEGDHFALPADRLHPDFYPRPPRGGRPEPRVGFFTSNGEFLSTPSARRATWPPVSTSSMYSNFYPRPPRGGRRFHSRSFSFGALFLSTPSARRATTLKSCQPPAGLISIHALREEGDRHSGGSYRQRTDFYPRPPRGGRPGQTPRPAVP